MADSRKNVSVGREYRDTYRNLVRILSSGCLDSAGVHLEDGEGGNAVICTDTCRYVYSEKAGAGSGVAIAMGGDGASWFAPVRRGAAFDDGTSEWKQLIYKVARDFHDKYSIIEYKRCDGSGNADEEEVSANVRHIIYRIFGRGDAAVIKGNDRDKGSEDIYGASVKLELSGTGQSQYVVMCKIFFRRTGNGIAPLSAREALQINAKLEEAQDNDDPISLTADESANINNVTVNAVRELVNGNYPVSFKDSLCFSTRRVLNEQTGRYEDNYDLKTYKFLAARANANNAPVTCNSIQVLGISHVEWINDYYEVAFGGKVLLQAVVGFGGSITLKCLNCGGTNLITSNTISYTMEDADGIKHTKNITLEYAKNDLGIDDKEFEEIKKYSEFANHMLPVTCAENKRLGKACNKMVCRSQTVIVNGLMKCADCPYPEVVYTDYSGDRPIRYLTGEMTFVHDRLSMALKKNAAKCSRCGRTFSGEWLTGGQCKLCASIDNLSGEDEVNAKKLYKKYANAFSHAVRLKHASDKKYCLEDDTALVFAIGKEVYVLDKLELYKDGFIAQPVKIN